MIEVDPLACQPVQVGGLDVGVAADPQGVPALLIGTQHPHVVVSEHGLRCRPGLGMQVEGSLVHLPGRLQISPHAMDDGEVVDAEAVLWTSSKF